MFFHWNKNLSAHKELVEDVEKGPEKSKVRTSRLFEIQFQALIYSRRKGVYSRNLRRKDRFYASASNKHHPLLKQKSGVAQRAGEPKLQCQRRDSNSKPGVGERDEKCSMTAEIEAALLR